MATLTIQNTSSHGVGVKGLPTTLAPGESTTVDSSAVNSDMRNAISQGYLAVSSGSLYTSDYTQTQDALTAVSNVDGATANLEFQDASSGGLTQAEFRVFAKTLMDELNAARADNAALNQRIDDLIGNVEQLYDDARARAS